MREDDADVVPRKGVARVDLGRLTIRGQRFRGAAGLVQHDAALVPELGRLGHFMNERLVHLERIGEVPFEEMDLRHRLAHQPPIFAALDREAILAQRFRVVAFLPERESEVEMRELTAFRHFRGRLLAQPVLGRLTLGAIPLQRQIGLRARERRVELDRPLGGGARVLMTPHVPQHERHQIMRVGVVGIERDRPLQRRERRLVQAAIVVDLAQVEMHDAGVGLLFRSALEPLGRHLQPATRLLGEPELNDRRDVLRLVGEQLLEFGDRLLEGAEDRVGAAQLPARVALIRRLAQPLLQLGDAAVVVAGIVVGDLEIALRDLHAWVELEGARELLDRLGDEAFLIVEDAEIVVRPCVRRIDPAGKGPQHREVPL